MSWWKDLHEWYLGLQTQCPYILAILAMRPQHRKDEEDGDHRSERNGAIFRQVMIALVIQLIMGVVTVSAGAVIAVSVVQNDIMHLRSALIDEKTERKEADGSLQERIQFLERRTGP